MDNNAWNRLALAISVIWLIIILFRLAAYFTMVSYTPEGRLFNTVLNIILIIGLVLVVVHFGRRFLRVTAAKVDREGRCQYCYAKLSPEDTFCPKCGMDVLRKGKD